MLFKELNYDRVDKGVFRKNVENMEISERMISRLQEMI